MATEHQQQQSIEDYIRHKRQSGASDQEITDHLVRAGWDQHTVASLLTDDVPLPPQPQQYNSYAQTGNTGQPLQVENVQYNMRMKPVESKVGLYLRLTMLALWVTVVAICVLLANLVNAGSDSTTDMGVVAVTVISICIISSPIFVIANKKLRATLNADQRLFDDLFFKKKVRGHLVLSVIAAAIAGFIAVYGLLSMLFLKQNDTKAGDLLAALIFTGGFGAILAFVWPLHAKTRR